MFLSKWIKIERKTQWKHFQVIGRSASFFVEMELLRKFIYNFPVRSINSVTVSVIFIQENILFKDELLSFDYFPENRTNFRDGFSSEAQLD